MNNTLDIIKYISFHPTGKNVLFVIPLPIAIKIVKNQISYQFDISEKKYTPILLKEKTGECSMSSTKCNIITTFGEQYNGYWFWWSKTEKKIVVTSNETMNYNEGFYLRDEHTIKRFGLMEL